MKERLEDLKKYFKTRGITQAEIAERLGVNHIFVNAVLCGRKNIGSGTAKKLSEAYGINPAWLLAGEGAMLKDNTISIGTVNDFSNQTAGRDINNGKIETAKESAHRIAELEKEIEHLKENIANMNLLLQAKDDMIATLKMVLNR